MRRRVFLGVCGGALALAPRAVRASGGLDIGDPVATHAMRVLLADDDGRTRPQTIDDSRFAWNGRSYRGQVQFVPLPNGRTGIVNVVPLDAYLYGVVTKEVGAGWPRAALEAQAIVARTYALGKLRPDRPYDVVASSSDQVYGGIEGETVEARDAVDATAGTAVTYRNAPAQVAFSSCCGGHSESSADAWGGAFAYLNGVVDPYCADSPEYRWHREIAYDVAAHALGRQLAGIGDLARVDLRDPDASGRPRTVALVGTSGESTLKTSAFRSALGASSVRSTFLRSVNVVREGSAPGTVAIDGNGNGHGVGMCQWGARGLAAIGADAAAIVAFYFPTTVLGSA
ncbi:MAG: SpoIID/LytB domain-containing protein [Candidatus Baltobacteraceae bacterium]